MKEVAAVFKQYTAVERIATVWRRVQELQGNLRTILDEEFDALFVPFLLCVVHPSQLRIHSFLHDASKDVDIASLSDACLVVDVLGLDVRYIKACSL